jgi:hypothetical protein
LKHAALLLALLLPLAVLAQGRAPVLPPGSQVQPLADFHPAQRLASEMAGGRQSFLVALGNTAFSSPLLYGAAAREAGITCNGCHVNGHNNPAFFIPGHSARPGGLDPTGPLFNPAADDGVANHVDIPSLRGIRFLAPYGRDGRIASLREFARHVIVNEFGGAEPAPLILDALVAYMNEFEFIPNPRLTPQGGLVDGSAAERRGEALFATRRGTAGFACADCHNPATAFTDGRARDAGSGRLRTPSLLNAGSSAPYGHDGRWPSLAEAADAMAEALGIPLHPAERADLLAYLDAVGDAEDAEDQASFGREMGELATYVALLDDTIARQDAALTRFVAETVRSELRRLAQAWPQGDAAHAARRPDRHKRLPLDVAALDAGLEAVARAMEGGRAMAAQAALDAYHDVAEAMVANYPRPARR